MRPLSPTDLAPEEPTGWGGSPTRAAVFPEAGHRADLAQCRALLATGSRSFFTASLLLPARIREPASALYAFCRLADDAVDLSADPAAGLAGLQGRLAAAYEGRPEDHPVDRAFAGVVRRFDIPRALPEALFEGFAWDAEGRRYETLEDLEGYAVRVAGTVGMMMSVLMGRRAPEVLARACDLGAAMQLTNIARDVGEDARAGRIYLPLAWLRSEGIDPAGFLARPEPSPALARILEGLLAAADRLYATGAAGIGRLPAGCRPAIRAAALIYAEIGREIRRNGLDSITRRAVVGGRRKALLAARAIAPIAPGTGGLHGPPIASAAGLVERTAGPSAHADGPRSGAERIVWVVDLFDRLERAERARRTAARRPGS
ncbi:phytoene/squalene synthase family protein [Prosthecomicrobium sp. N25]|uniref:phytoene/squalene synthase family protein n=1 Tax=Prosthecomicrobium sp. N25 TaxID=3129254 RepID=UPI00307770CD